MSTLKGGQTDKQAGGFALYNPVTIALTIALFTFTADMLGMDILNLSHY